MNDPMIIASAAVLIIGALSTGIVSIIVALGKMKAEIIRQLKEAGAKQEEIHSLVNGSSITAANKLTILEDKISFLNEKINDLQEKRLEDAKQSEPIHPKISEVKDLLMTHDEWERQERIEASSKLDAIHEAIVVRGNKK